MDDTFEIIKRLVKNQGLLIVAHILEHSDTQRLKRWISKDHIPQAQIAGVRAILIQKGEIK